MKFYFYFLILAIKNRIAFKKSQDFDTEMKMEN
jgi:hypothetical protein